MTRNGSGDYQHPGDYDDEGRCEFSERLSDLVHASQGFGGRSLEGALDDVWHFVFGEEYPHKAQWRDPAEKP